MDLFKKELTARGRQRYGRAVNEFDESKIKRDKDGKFGSGGGGDSSSVDDTQELTELVMSLESALDDQEDTLELLEREEGKDSVGYKKAWKQYLSLGEELEEAEQELKAAKESK